MSTLTEPSDFTVFTFLPGSLDARGAVALLRGADLGFVPSEVALDVPGADMVRLPFGDDVWEQVLATPEVEGIELTAGPTGPRASYSSFRVQAEVQLSGVPPTPGLVAALVDVPGLVGGAHGDFTDAIWQGEEDPQHYAMWFDGPWEHLPRTTNEWGEEVIDVSGNPGRDTEVPGMRLWAAQDLWFGPGAALVIDLDALGSLPVGRTTDLGDGRWHVRLWEDGAGLEEIRKAQQVLRDHLGYDAAPARADGIRAALTAGRPEDPTIVVEHGSFPHGGVERFLQYFSASRHPIPRSRAALLNVQEYDADHQRVHVEEIDLTTQPHPHLG